MLNGLDLFSGIGGLSLALGKWVKPIAYCENDKYAQSVLLSRISTGQLPQCPIWDNITSLNSAVLHYPIDIIYGGFPCQDISVAGNGVGLEGKRSGLFFEIIRLASEIRPRFIFLENVAAITVRGLDRVLLELTKIGYDSRWTIVSAAEVGACHQRDRWFLLAHSNGHPWWDKQIKEQWIENKATASNNCQNTSYPYGSRLEGSRRKESEIIRPSKINEWNSEPTVRRGVNGISNRVDRIKGLGNAVVPIQAKEAFERLMGIQ